DALALGALYDRYATLLLPLAFRILKDRAESEDVIHDGFIAMVRNATRYTPERGTVAAWLVTIVRNLAIDRARRRVRRVAIARERVAREPSEPDAAPESVADGRTARARVRRALAELPAAQRATLESAFFEGLSYPELAEREGVPLGTIKSRAARG